MQPPRQHELANAAEAWAEEASRSLEMDELKRLLDQQIALGENGFGDSGRDLSDAINGLAGGSTGAASQTIRGQHRALERDFSRFARRLARHGVALGFGTISSWEADFRGRVISRAQEQIASNKGERGRATGRLARVRIAGGVFTAAVAAEQVASGEDPGRVAAQAAGATVGAAAGTAGGVVCGPAAAGCGFAFGAAGGVLGGYAGDLLYDAF